MGNKVFLPIGTICKLKNGVKNVMITGFCPVTDESEKGMYDYCGCLYPEGMISSDMNLLFDNEQIEEILYKGFENSEEEEFKRKLVEIMNEKFSNLNNDVSDKAVDNDFSNDKVEIPIMRANTLENDSEIETL